MRAVVVALLIVLSAAPAHAAPEITVRVDPASQSQVGRDFAGFSYEKDRVGARMFNARNAGLVRLFRLLGPSLLRIGGNLVDMTTWNPDGPGGRAEEVTPADVRELALFAKATAAAALPSPPYRRPNIHRPSSVPAMMHAATGAVSVIFAFGLNRHSPNGRSQPQCVICVLHVPPDHRRR